MTTLTDNLTIWHVNVSRDLNTAHPIPRGPWVGENAMRKAISEWRESAGPEADDIWDHSLAEIGSHDVRIEWGALVDQWRVRRNEGEGFAPNWDDETLEEVKASWEKEEEIIFIGEHMGIDFYVEVGAGAVFIVGVADVNGPWGINLEAS